MSEELRLQVMKKRDRINKLATNRDVRYYMETKSIPNHYNRVWQDEQGWKTYVPDDTNKYGRKLIKRVSYDDLYDAVVNYYISAGIYFTMQQVFNEWVEWKLKYKDIQKQTYDRYIQDYARFFGESKFNNRALISITEDELEEYIRDTIIRMNLKRKAWSNMRTILIGIFKFGKKRKYCDINIRDFLQDLELSKNMFDRTRLSDRESVYKDSEIEKIEKLVREQYYDSILELGILFMFKTGLRNGELSTLKPEDIEGNMIHIQRTEVHYKDERGKTIYVVRDNTKGRDGERDVVLSDSAVEVLKKIRRLNPFGEYLFEEDGRRFENYFFARRLEKLCREVGIKYRSPHKVRKTYGTKLLKAGVADKIVQKQMGHTEIDTTRRYYYFDNSEENEVLELMNNVIG